MIAPLRRAHRIATLAIAVAVPPAFALALATRPVLPPAGAIPAALEIAPAAGERLEERDDLFPGLAIRTAIFAGGGVELVPLVDLERPDVLVYWSPDASADGLPAGARWLGRLAGTSPRRFELPAATREQPGHLHLYSLGHAEWLGSAALGMP